MDDPLAGPMGIPMSKLPLQRQALGSHILVADDNADMRDYFHRLLTPYWKVTTTHDGLEALEQARRNPPDLFLASIIMPNLDGFGLLQQIRTDKALKAIPVVLIMAQEDEKTAIRGQIFGYQNAEIIGQSNALLFTSEHRQQQVHQQELVKAQQDGLALNERWHIRKDESRFYASGVTRPLRYSQGRLRGFVKVARELTLQKQLEVAEQEQRQLAESLRDTALALNQSLELDRVPDHILENVGRVIPHYASHVILLKDGKLDRIRSRGYAEHQLGDIEAVIAASSEPLQTFNQLSLMAITWKPFVVPDTYTSEHWYDPFQSGRIRSSAGVPILGKNGVIGFLMLDALQTNFFSERQIEPLQAFAAQVVLAIQNAHLHQAAQELAIVQERQHLARDLHDSISQMLYASSMIAEALSKLPGIPDKVLNNLEQLKRLNRGALAEMRSLLQELRLAAVNNLEMDMLLYQLAESMMGHSKISVSVEMEVTHPFPKSIQEPMYRITQEALNNVVKHAHATQVIVQLISQPEQVILSIKDNGRGFDWQKLSAKNMGVAIMQERAKTIGATVRFTTKPGQGTEVNITWQPGNG